MWSFISATMPSRLLPCDAACRSVARVRMGPGHTAFTRTPRLPASSAAQRVSWATAPLVAEYGMKPGCALNELMEARFTMAAACRVW